MDGEVAVCRCESEAWKEAISNVDKVGWKEEETAIGESGRQKVVVASICGGLTGMFVKELKFSIGLNLLWGNCVYVCGWVLRGRGKRGSNVSEICRSG